MFFRKKRRRVAEEVRSRLGNVVAIDDIANCFGLESKGAFQVRGNGCLAASQDELLFVMWYPRREILIDRELITSVERTKWHLGKSVFRPLLLVRFADEMGQPDSVAWYVRDLPMWEAALSG